MKRLLLAACAASLALTMSACTDTPPITSAPTLSQTEADERAIAFAFRTAEVLEERVALLRQGGHPCCTAGTANANIAARHLERLATMLEAASIAQKAGNRGVMSLNLGEAEDLMSQLRALIEGER